MRTRATVLVLLFVSSLAAGCFDGGPTDPAGTSDSPAAPAPGVGIDESKLTEPLYDILPQFVEYVPAKLDGARLHVEVYLPDGDGPWPTILESSPYNFLRGNGELEGYTDGTLVDDRVANTGLVERYVRLGYAVVHAHVRGTGNSEGCMNMMGAKEQSDQATLVEWVAAQPWSDGKVAMHGVSYVGTTPHEALIMAPDPLVTVVTIAGVTNQWRNTFQNGVPYLGRYYPLTYEVLVGAPPPTDLERGPAWAANAASAACEQEEAVHAMSPGVYEKGVYDAYWDERNFTKFTHRANASILYSQGFADRAVNPMEAVFWLNDLPVEKKAFFHQVGHQYPPREDYFVTEHAWFDYWLKGIDNGVMKTPAVEVQLNTGDIRLDDAWPPRGTQTLRLNLTVGGLVDGAVADAAQTYTADMGRNAAGSTAADDALDQVVLSATGNPNELTFQTAPLDGPVHMTGVPMAHLIASVDAPNTYFLLDLYDVDPDGAWTRLTEGWMNAHLWKTFNESNPLTPGQPYPFDFRFEPREYVFDDGHRIGLRIHGNDGRVFPVDRMVTQNTIAYGADGSWIELPVLTSPTVHSGDGINTT